MPITKQTLRRLGLGGVLSSNSNTQFIDDNKITHKSLQDATLDIVNEGTLRQPKPVLSIKQVIDATENCKTYQTYTIPIEIEGYYSEMNFKYPLLGQLSFFNLGPKKYAAEENDNFIPILKNTKLPESYFQQFKPHGQFVFPPGTSNTARLTGFYTNATGKTTPFVNSQLISFTGKQYKDSFNYRAWKTSDTQDISPTSYNNFYIPYPLTIYQTNYNAYAIPTKVANSFVDTQNLASGESPLNGLFLISTGNGVKSKVCYVSPHGYNSGLIDTFVFAQGFSINSFSNITGVKKISSGLSVRAVTIGTEYFTGTSAFSGSGIYVAANSGFFDNATKDFYITGITGVANQYMIGTNQHIRQTTPLKDTLFYKFYSGIYTGSKTLNTGTWDGIIPADTVFQMEIISTELNKEIGMKFPAYIIYTGYGLNDEVDAKCTKYLQHLTSGETLGDTTFLVNGNSFDVIGRGNGTTKEQSWNNANKNLQYNINSKVSKILKKYIPSVIKQNSKYKKFIKFVNKYRV